MKLVKLKMKNFRCFTSETIFIIDDLTSIIGKNDIGKSTVLEALDCFFNDKIDQGDISIDATGNNVEVTCYFEGIPDQIILDTSVPTSPIEEGILNTDNQLEIKKVYTFGARKSISIFLIGNYPNDERIGLLLNKNNAQLKNLAEELGVNLDGISRTKNPPIRQRKNYLTERTPEKMVDADAANGK